MVLWGNTCGIPNGDQKPGNKVPRRDTYTLLTQASTLPATVLPPKTLYRVSSPSMVAWGCCGLAPRSREGTILSCHPRCRRSSPSPAMTPLAPFSSLAVITAPSTTWVSSDRPAQLPRIWEGTPLPARTNHFPPLHPPRRAEVPPAYEGQRPPGQRALPGPS